MPLLPTALLPEITIAIGQGPPERVPICGLSDGSGPSPQSTQVLILADLTRISFAFRCEDEDAWGTLTNRGDPVWSEECVEVFLAPGDADPVDYFEFEISPLGTLFEARIHHPSGHRADMTADPAWRCAGIEWNAEIMRHPGQWTANLLIPWAALGFPDPAVLPRTWRLNLYRIDRPRDGSPAVYTSWSPTYESPANFHVPSRFGTLRLVSVS